MNEFEQPEEALFETALKLPLERRSAYLDEACAGDVDLRRRVEVLLGAFERAGGFMKQSPAPTPERTALFSLPPTEKPGDRIGRYKLLEQIGEGGCGLVYVAEQAEPVRRRVALKVIKLGMDTKQVIARFDAERQALAMMDHPNIAKVLDAGATETGRPYFVMELVRGIKITDYCDQNHVSPRERLDLFIQVCHAIQHAHQKGVIHRDIKPSNILVTLHDGVPVPKVIDFGIAKATQGRLTDQTVYTAFEQFIGTPAYMSPEQAEMSGLDIDTRSDIYSLGVLLYELLTRTTPFDAKELLASGLDEMRRTIREVDPVRPSTRLTQELVAAGVSPLKSHRSTEGKVRASSRRLLQEVRGDLDWIVMKCLEKDRTRRYETANGLAADIQRHLDCEPVVARPPSRLYEFQKTVRRHKFGFGAAAAVGLSLAIGLVISTISLTRERAARERAVAAEREAEADKKLAQTEASKSVEVATFLKDMLAGVGPSVARGRDAAMLRDILQHTAERVGTNLKTQPEVEAELRDTIGKVYYDLGDYERAETMHREALRLRKALFGETNRYVSDSLVNLADALDLRSRFAEARELHEEALRLRRSIFGEQHPDVATSMHRVALLLWRQDEYDAAEKLHREALATRRKLLPPDDAQIALSLNDLGLVLTDEGKLADAEESYREALAIRRNSHGDDNPEVAETLSNLARVLQKERKLQEGETAARESLALRRKVLGAEHPKTVHAINSLAGVLGAEGKFAEAESLFREAVTISKTLPSREAVALMLRNFGIVLFRQQKLPEAEAIFRESVAMYKALGRKPSESLFDLAQVLQAEGKLTEAEATYQEAADSGSAKTQNTLGTMYQNGDGVPQNVTEALKWYRRAAEQNCPDAQRNLGWMYVHGVGVPQDRAEAARWYRKAADQNDAVAQVRLGRMCQRGEGVPQDSIESEKWYRRALEGGNAEILNDIAQFLAMSPDPNTRDGTNALRFAEKAVAATSRTNAAYLGTLAAAYAETGDFERAVSTQKEAIAQAHLQADKSDFESRLKLFEARTHFRE